MTRDEHAKMLEDAAQDLADTAQRILAKHPKSLAVQRDAKRMTSLAHRNRMRAQLLREKPVHEQDSESRR